MEKQPKVSIRFLGVDEATDKILTGYIKGGEIVRKAYDLDELLAAPTGDEPSLVICGANLGELAINEIAQTVRMQYQHCPIYFATIMRKNFNRKNLQKNGFTDAFLLPSDAYALAQQLSGDISSASAGELISYRSVKLADIEPGEVLDFDVFIFLPQNQKYVRVVSEGQALDKTRADRLSKGEQNSVHITTDKIANFQKFTAEQIKKKPGSANSLLSETEKNERRENSVRNLMSSLFADAESTADSLSKGRDLINECKEVIQLSLADLGGDEISWFTKLSSRAGMNYNPYSHASNVSTYAALFSQALEIGVPQDLALAGLLHDVGIAEMPLEIQLADPDQMDKATFEIYKTHPELSVAIIKDRKMVMAENLQKAILQHHEKSNGTGYPKGVQAPRLSLEAQIIALADIYDRLTSVTQGKPKLAPQQALQKIVEGSLNNISGAHFDFQLMQKLSKLFPYQNSKTEKAS